MTSELSYQAHSDPAVCQAVNTNLPNEKKKNHLIPEGLEPRAFCQPPTVKTQLVSCHYCNLAFISSTESRFSYALEATKSLVKGLLRMAKTTPASQGDCWKCVQEGTAIPSLPAVLFLGHSGPRYLTPVLVPHPGSSAAMNPRQLANPSLPRSLFLLQLSSPSCSSTPPAQRLWTALRPGFIGL